MEIYRPNITFFETDTLMYDHASTYLSDIILDICGNEGLMKLAVSGGSTPIRLYNDLAKNPVLDWENVEIFQIDERFVPTSSTENNQQSIRHAFGEDVIERMRSAYFVNTHLPLDQSLENYEEVMDSLEDPLFDVAIVGIGADGHFASLFPHGKYLTHLDQKVISTTAGNEYTTKQRISLSIESVLSSETLIVLLKGKDKEGIIKELLEGKRTASEYPAKFLLSHPNLHIFQSMEDFDK
jgi:6-phosphogluconolactonase